MGSSSSKRAARDGTLDALRIGAGADSRLRIAVIISCEAVLGRGFEASYAARLAKSDGLDMVDVVGGYSLPDKAFRQSSEARKLDGAVRRFGRLPRRRR